MRVKKADLDVIVSTLKSSISDAAIYLFGSRVDDTKKGGDIDIFITTSQFISLSDKITLLTQMERKGIQRKIDLIIQTPDQPKATIYNEVLQKGVRLC